MYVYVYLPFAFALILSILPLNGFILLVIIPRGRIFASGVPIPIAFLPVNADGGILTDIAVAFTLSLLSP